MVQFVTKICGYLIGVLMVALLLAVMLGEGHAPTLGVIAMFAAFTLTLSLPGYLLFRTVAWKLGRETYPTALFCGGLTGILAVILMSQGIALANPSTQLFFAIIGSAGGAAVLRAEQAAYHWLGEIRRKNAEP